MSLVIFNDSTLDVVEDIDHVFVMSTKDIASGYRCSIDSINHSKKRNADELIEGTHFIMTRTTNNAAKTMWTKLGVVTLGFFIKSERAKEFRKWAANYVLNGHEADNGLKEIIMQQNEQIAQLTKELESKPKKLPAKPRSHHCINDGSWRELSALIAVAAEAMDEADKMSAILSQRANFLMSVLDGFTARMCNDELFSQSRRSSPYLNAHLPYRSPKRHEYFHKK